MKVASREQAYQFSQGRRNFIINGVATIATTSLSVSSINLFFNHLNRIKAIAFDAFPIFDPRPVYSLAENMFPEKGRELSNIWRAKQFEYCWLRASSKQYRDFWGVTEDSLVFASKKIGLDLSPGNRKMLMDQYLQLNIWDDVLPALKTLKKKGIRLSFLSNMTAGMIESCMNHSKIGEYFEHVISTDRVRSYKPDPRAYQSGLDILKLKKEEILFVAFAGWDASGSKWFGYPTFWVNRLASPVEELHAKPDGIGKGMSDLLDFIRQL
ncbi:MAG TPA: haloacid dehalogenase type II [Chitinophagaceae bacterium]|nr:haloacid dehalogenase type II [Chitinophagaceae bacterium]